MKIANLVLQICSGSERTCKTGPIVSIRNFVNRTCTASFIAFVVLCSSATSVYAQSLIEQIGWKGADSRIIAGVLLAFTVVFVLLMVVYFKNRLKGEQDQKEMSEQLFDEYVEKAQLTPHEITTLNQLVSNVNISDRCMIFQSIAIFEQCIEKEVQKITSMKTPHRERMDDNRLLSEIRKKLGYNYVPFEHPIVSSRNIEVGQKVSLYASSAKQASQGFHAIIVMNQEFSLRVQVNFEQGENVIFNQGDVVKLAFARQGDGIYGIDMKVFSFDGSSVLELQHTLEMKRNQLRQFVRIEVNLPLKLRIIKAVNDNDKELVGKQLQAKIIDISGGGLSFILDQPLVPGEIISMNFQLSTITFSGEGGRILRVSLVDGKTTTSYRHHVTFSEIKQSAREKVIKYVFEKQRQLNQWR